MKQCCALVLLLTTSLFATTQIPSPEQFLGYKIGTHYTPHYRIVEYFKAVTAASSSTVKLQQYGITNEGRPLLVVYVSSAQNISNLESIRSKNIERTTGGAKNNSGENVAVVWLSYNVHGNEAASSEASMLTLYALVDPSNTQTKTWLQNTVVIMDPCLNPDGRDRYVNWYNSVVGKTYNPSPESREHREPWPGGRSNHYNFDLNRDWAWQTQIETQQRLALYNQWLPQVHVDFHEQGYNNPYYFAPAAEPFHEVITPFQREFQAIIGRNHAKYFDEKGWLYFTKEQFDLLYPSYGDTYPIYNGSIGMTYEQGGIGAGLGVVTENGDTLTLVDRAMHHYTTGLSTIEVASKNAPRLIAEFEKYYREVNNGVGDVKAYVVKMNAGDTARMMALVDLLKKNNIHYFSGRGNNLRGLSYTSLKDEAFILSPADLIVPSGQPKGALVKVLFEQSTKLSDSATYDITAWSLPYAYGLQAYATEMPVTGLEEYRINKAVNIENGDPYAYVIPWTGLNAAKLTGRLLQKGVKLRFITTPFASGGQTFNRGSVIVMRTGNNATQNLFSLTRSLANDAGVRLATVTSGFVEKGLDFGSSSVVPIKRRKIAMITGEGVSSLAAGEVWHYFEQQLNYPLTLFNTTDVGRMNWNDYDVIIMPDGNYRFLSDKTSADALKAWINGGGHLIALEGALSNLSKLDWAIKAKKGEDTNTKDKDPLATLRRYDDRERESLKDFTPGSIYKVQLDNTHPLAFGYPSSYYTLKMDNSQYEFLKDDGWNVGVIKKDKAVSGFVGSSLSERLHNSLQFGVQNVGRGTVTYFADDVLFRSFWENGKLLFANAVFLVGQ
ncbi:M14 family metallopeptidase [Flavisolibacter ginsenosidimutans]|uniref:Zinc carboxypeptidase n=1 Tax=Flavisolibacter ginsenosidimutans TaxID=661481 RepID=A0A5B8UGE2_9BACT|nr:M14 family metallopeptidase [Flavisolibacter ginsenosidimutans]QEC55731.1 zinc carboxypeptidase [Flavisolibacter ginsenosidimutans]